MLLSTDEEISMSSHLLVDETAATGNQVLSSSVPMLIIKWDLVPAAVCLAKGRNSKPLEI